jgi:hypothetical protein
VSYTDYKCSTCKKRYRSYGTHVSCCVQHPSNECCHAFEVRVSKHGIVKGLKPIDLSGSSVTTSGCTCGGPFICMVHDVTITNTGYVS